MDKERALLSLSLSLLPLSFFCSSRACELASAATLKLVCSVRVCRAAKAGGPEEEEGGSKSLLINTVVDDDDDTEDEGDIGGDNDVGKIRAMRRGR